MKYAGPPKLAARLLDRRLASHPLRDSILGDLAEEHDAIARRRGRTAAALWYWRHSMLLPRIQVRGVMSELRQALRNAFKHPAHTTLVIVALALGLGLNAAVFSMGDALLFRPLPLPHADRLVVIGHYRPGEIQNLAETVAPATHLDWHASGGPFDRMVAFTNLSANLTGREGAERIIASRVSPDFFETLGVQLPTGRAFSADDAVVGRHHVAILGDALWHRRFGGQMSIVGQTIQIDNRPYTVVGIAPRNISFPNGTELWMPLAYDTDEAATRNSRYMTVIARLGDGATLETAQAHIAVVAANLARRYPTDMGTLQTDVRSLAEGMGDPGAGQMIVVWQVSAALVLLIACANVASLLLARGATRSRELAVRLAIGASRWRLVRQLLSESLVLAFLAVPIALGLAWWMLRVIKAYMPARIAGFIMGWHEIDIDGRVMLFTAAGAVITTVLFGLLPALQSSRLEMVDTLKQGGRGSTAGRLRLRKILVTAEIALALPLLVASGMTALGTWRFINGPQGYEPDGVLAFKTTLPDEGYPDLAARARFADQVVEKLKAIPGVTHAAATNVNPSSNAGWSTRYELEGEAPFATPDQRPVADYRTVTPGYLETLRLPLTRGRHFTSADTRESLPVAIVSESFVARHWPGQDPLGKRLVFAGRERLAVTIVGVAGNHIHDWFLPADRPAIFRPAAQTIQGTQAFVIRTTGDPAVLAPAVRAAVAEVDRNQPIYQIMRQTDQVRERAIGPQYAAGLMALFGVLALLLSVIGIYALVGYFVAQRRQEIGVRMALGAQARDVVRMTVRQAAVMAGVGVAIGGAAAYAIARVLESALLGIAQNDPRLLAGFAAALALSALAAGYVPARRAAAIDPMLALRND